jgi:hypothetical protein
VKYALHLSARLAFALLAAFFVVTATGAGYAAVITPPPDNAVSDKSAPAKPSGEALPSKITVMPHRAIYDMSLTSVKNGSNITGVSGRMLFEWADVCDGWAVQQHLKLHFTYAEGDESDVTSTEITYESKDGKRYNFNIRRVSDGKETEHYVGKAALNDDGSGVASYSIPEGKTEKLPAGTIFPSAHTELILDKAAAGERLFTRHVFDGSDEDGSNDVSAFISAPDAHWLDTEVNAQLKSSPLLAWTAWPVRMAFFKKDTETGEPDYEMNLNLLADGVARTMRIDYGDFSVTGTLSNIEALPNPGC